MTWSTDTEIPDQRSSEAPALEEHYASLHMVHVGSASNDLWHSIYDGHRWSDNVRIPNQKSKAAPALASFGGLLHMVHLGNTSNQLWHSTWDGHQWTDNDRIPDQKSKKTPALAVYGDLLHMVHLGNTSNDLWHSTWDGHRWTDNDRIPDQKSKKTPALATFESRLHMVHLGNTSNQLWHSMYDGTDWSDNVEIPEQKSKAPPSLTIFGMKLHMVHIGNVSNTIWYSHYYNGRWTANVPLPHHLSQAAPAIQGRDTRIHMVHIGNTSHKIWHSTSDGVLSRVRIGAKILQDASGSGVITNATLDNWVDNMRTVYESMGFRVELVDTESLNLPGLLIPDVGTCVRGITTSDQRTLFGNRNNLAADDIAVYFVNATVPSANGCAAHPRGVPACIVVDHATGWTMAHECGHVLGLKHIDNNDRLMTENGTSNITNPPPNLTYGEGVDMAKSDFSRE
jgi:hypothetical protein